MTRTEERELAEERGENPREEQYRYDHPEEVEERVELVSNCCGVPMNEEQIKYEKCPHCFEGCTVINLYEEN